MKCYGGLGSPGKEVEGATPTHEELTEGVTTKLPAQEASSGDVAERRTNPLWTQADLGASSASETLEVDFRH